MEDKVKKNLHPCLGIYESNDKTFDRFVPGLDEVEVGYLYFDREFDYTTDNLQFISYWQLLVVVVFLVVISVFFIFIILLMILPAMSTRFWVELS